MRTVKLLILAVAVGGGLLVVGSGRADAQYRQYYGSWTYYPSTGYYYRYYYYKPYSDYEGYSYHYAVYYPTYPRYVYYYNPYRSYYWGRLDLEAKDENKYSLLAEDDRKKTLKDIPEKAFPKPAKMPKIPEAKDDVAIEPPPNDTPKAETPKDVPGGEK